MRSHSSSVCIKVVATLLFLVCAAEVLASCTSTCNQNVGVGGCYCECTTCGNGCTADQSSQCNTLAGGGGGGPPLSNCCILGGGGSTSSPSDAPTSSPVGVSSTPSSSPTTPAPTQMSPQLEKMLLSKGFAMYSTSSDSGCNKTLVVNETFFSQTWVEFGGKTLQLADHTSYHLKPYCDVYNCNNCGTFHNMVYSFTLTNEASSSLTVLSVSSSKCGSVLTPSVVTIPQFSVTTHWACGNVDTSLSQGIFYSRGMVLTLYSGLSSREIKDYLDGLIVISPNANGTWVYNAGSMLQANLLLISAILAAIFFWTI